MNDKIPLSPLDRMMKLLARLPGLGPRSARRLALYLLTTRGGAPLDEMITALQDARDHTHICDICGNLDSVSPCRICQDSKRDATLLCVVASVADIWAIERTNIYRGRYHVLGGVLSPLDGVGPDQLRIASLLERLNNEEIGEVILALSATVDGQTTGHYLSDKIEALGEFNITRLAHGVPVGGELDYLDAGTITTALKARSKAS